MLEKPGLQEATVGHLNQLRYADRHRFEYSVRQHVTKHTAPSGAQLGFRTNDYRRSVAENMRDNGTPEEQRIGAAIIASPPEDVRYVEVSQPIDSSGNLGDIRARDYEDAE